MLGIATPAIEDRRQDGDLRKTQRRRHKRAIPGHPVYGGNVMIVATSATVSSSEEELDNQPQPT